MSAADDPPSPHPQIRIGPPSSSPIPSSPYPNQPLPALPGSAGVKHGRQISASYRTFVSTSGGGDFESPRIPYFVEQPEDSPTLPEDGTMPGGDDEVVVENGAPTAGSSSALHLSHPGSSFRKASGGDPRERVLQHHPSQANSLKTMNSQSSLAGLPTARSNRHNVASSSSAAGDSTPRSSSRAASRQPSGQQQPPNLPSSSQNGVSAKTSPTPAPKDATTGETPKPTSKKPSSQPVATTTTRVKFRHTPHLPQYEAERVPAAMMHWSKAPVHGALPSRSMRAHTVTMVDHMAWVFGGCDDRGCWRDVWCFDIETFQWSHPEMRGDMPPPCRAHTATLVDRKIFVFGGGEGPTYYNDLYILDTLSHRWTKPNIPQPHPLPRRAHTAVLYRDIIYVFGGGNGHRALNDLWALDVSVTPDRLEWKHVRTEGTKPGARGYHTANLVGEVMVVLGGSDGRECFSDVWVLDLEKMIWREVHPEKTYRRLSHSSTQVGSYLFVTGGHDGNKYSHDLLLFNLVTLQFEPRQTQGKPPTSRGYHVTTLADSRLWVFGGFDGHMVYDDVWLLDLAAAAYLPQVTSFGILVE